MSTLRGVAPFHELWKRRTTIEIDGESLDLMSLQDLVRAKQTQRSRDWPMVERLMERYYFELRDSPGSGDAEFALRELRTPDVLIEAVARFPDAARKVSSSRPS